MPSNLVVTDIVSVVGRDQPPLVGVRDWYDYINGTRGARKGTVYTVLKIEAGTALVDVKVLDMEAIITQEELDEANRNLRFVICKFSGFSASIYASRDGQLKSSCTAATIEIVKGANKASGAFGAGMGDMKI